MLTAYWKTGRLEDLWNTATLEYWMIGRLDNWKIGEILEYWITGSLYFWKSDEILELWFTIKDVLLVAFVQHLEVSIIPVLKITSWTLHCSHKKVLF